MLKKYNMTFFVTMILVLGCRASEDPGGSCVKATLSGTGYHLTDYAALGGYVEVSEKGNSKGEYKSCTMTLTENLVDVIESGGWSQLATSRHCFDWLNTDFSNAVLKVYVPKEKQYKEIKVELESSQVLTKFSKLADLKIMQQAAVFAENLAFGNCKASQYALLHPKESREEAYFNYKRLAFYNHGYAIDPEIEYKRKQLFAGVPCFNPFDLISLRFKVKSRATDDAKIIVSSVEEPKIKREMSAVKTQTDFFNQFIVEFIYYSALSTKYEGEREKLAKEMKDVFAEYGLEDLKGKVSDNDLVIQKAREFTDKFEEFERKIQAAMAKGLATMKQGLVHSNVIIEKAKGETGNVSPYPDHLFFANIHIPAFSASEVKVDLAHAISPADMDGVLAYRSNAFYFPRKGAASDSKADTWGQEFGKSDSGTIVTVGGAPMLSLVSVGDQAVVKIASRIGATRDGLNPDNFEEYKDKMRKQVIAQNKSQGKGATVSPGVPKQEEASVLEKKGLSTGGLESGDTSATPEIVPTAESATSQPEIVEQERTSGGNMIFDDSGNNFLAKVDKGGECR